MTDLDQRIREAFGKRTAQELTGPQISYSNGFKDGYKAALPRWIPVSERLPEAKTYGYSENVIVAVTNGDMQWTTVDRFDSASETWDEVYCPAGSFYVYAWQPLPQPPEVD